MVNSLSKALNTVYLHELPIMHYHNLSQYTDRTPAILAATLNSTSLEFNEVTATSHPEEKWKQIILNNYCRSQQFNLPIYQVKLISILRMLYLIICYSAELPKRKSQASQAHMTQPRLGRHSSRYPICYDSMNVVVVGLNFGQTGFNLQYRVLPSSKSNLPHNHQQFQSAIVTIMLPTPLLYQQVISIITIVPSHQLQLYLSSIHQNWNNRTQIQKIIGQTLILVYSQSQQQLRA